MAHGGHCVARHEGQVVFVRHTLPGERVVARVTEGRVGDSFVRADAVEVLDAADGRVAPPCAYAAPGRCGGCDFQHASLEHATGAQGGRGPRAVLAHREDRRRRRRAPRPRRRRGAPLAHPRRVRRRPGRAGGPAWSPLARRRPRRRLPHRHPGRHRLRRARHRVARRRVGRRRRRRPPRRAGARPAARARGGRRPRASSASSPTTGTGRASTSSPRAASGRCTRVRPRRSCAA